MRPILTLAALLPAAVLLDARALPAQVTYVGGTYTQTFDALAGTGAGSVAFTDNGTLPGWYANRTTYLPSDGTSGTGSLYAFGNAGSTDRALGAVASGSASPILFGLRIVNGTGAALTSFTVTYTGEQWRDGGGASAANTLAFQYAIGATSLTAGTFVSVAALDFTAPVNGGGTTSSGVAVDGNAAGNRLVRSATIGGITLASGQELWLRFTDVDDAGADDGLAIDDFSFSATGTVVPEPSTLTLLGGGLAVVAGGVRRRRRAR